MKTAIVLLALVSLAYTAPQPRKLFHEHFEDFMMVIGEKSGHELDHLLEHYLEFEEFRAGLDFVASKDFLNIIQEFEDLPEFAAVVDFLEGHTIDITYFIDTLNDLLANINANNKRHELSGRDVSAYIQDCIDLFPKEELIALYDSKMAEDESFKNAMDDLASDEWDELFEKLWQNETFQVEIQILLDNGIDVYVILKELKAVFGKF